MSQDTYRIRASKPSTNGHARLPAITDDEAYGHIVAVAAGRERMTTDRFSGPLLDLLTVADQDRVAGLSAWLDQHADVPELAEFVSRARDGISKATAAHEAGRFSLGLSDTASFFARSFDLEWLARGVLVKDQPCVFGGPSKTLKTSILIDLAISLASMTPFLGRFQIPSRRRVAFISGESGRAVIQANAKQVCNERRLPYSEAAGIYWGFELPNLSNDEHREVIARTIRDHEIEVIAFDPLYLMLLSGGGKADAKDMFQMGPLLSDIAVTCQEAGATPVLCHHFVKNREDPLGPPTSETWRSPARPNSPVSGC
jgi:hypothetical protein